MYVLAIQSQKGGVGKTTIAVNLAVAAERAGHTTIVLDLDPQGSASGWRDSRQAEAPAVVPIIPARLAQSLKTAAEAGAALAIIDTPPHAEGSALAAARAADLILVPVRPSSFDLRAIGATVDICKLAARPAFCLLNATPPLATTMISEARAAVAVHGIGAAPITLAQLAAFVHAATLGLGVAEYEPEGRAAAEIAALWIWISGELKRGEQ